MIHPRLLYSAALAEARNRLRPGVASPRPLLLWSPDRTCSQPRASGLPCPRAVPPLIQARTSTCLLGPSGPQFPCSLAYYLPARHCSFGLVHSTLKPCALSGITAVKVCVGGFGGVPPQRVWTVRSSLRRTAGCCAAGTFPTRSIAWAQGFVGRFCPPIGHQAGEGGMW